MALISRVAKRAAIVLSTCSLSKNRLSVTGNDSKKYGSLFNGSKGDARKVDRKHSLVSIVVSYLLGRVQICLTFVD